MHDGSTFNHRYVKSNPQEVENATWMLTVSSLSLSLTRTHAKDLYENRPSVFSTGILEMSHLSCQVDPEVLARCCHRIS